VDGFAGQMVVRAHGYKDGIAVEKFGAEDAVVGWGEWAGEADIDAAFFEGGELLGCVHLHERETNAGVTAAELTDNAGKEAARAPEKEADVEGTDFALEGFSGEVDGAVGGFEGFASLFKEDLTFGGETDGAAGAVEEDAADFAFEVEHLLADG